MDARSEVTSAPDVGGTGRAAMVVVGIEMKRQPFFMVRLVFIPPILIVLLSFAVFWMDRSSLGDRMAVSFVGILTAVAYQTMVSDLMPRISYFTLMNGVLNLSFFMMCATVVVNLRVGSLDNRGAHAEGERLDLRCRWLFPTVFVSLLAGCGLLTFLWS